MIGGNLSICVRIGGGRQNRSALADDVFGNRSVNATKVESGRLDVFSKDRISIYENGLSKIDCFEKGIPKSFVETRKGDKIRMRI